MENMIRIFENEEFGKVRTVIKDGEPWFVGKMLLKFLAIQIREMRLQNTLILKIKLTSQFTTAGKTEK